MRLLVTGAGGMLACDVGGGGPPPPPPPPATALSEQDLDVTDALLVAAALAELKPDAVVNCAAWTDVDGAEADEATALQVNGVAPGHLARAAADLGAQLVQVSTDYVFDGTARRPYLESDPTGPRSAYGRTKLAGEQAVLAAGGGHAVVRTAWLFGAAGKNFVATMLALAASRDSVTVVADQIGSPTFTGHLAPALVDIAERRLAGVAHVAGAGQCAWSELAAQTFEQAAVSCIVQPVASSEFPRPAPRPAWSVLASERDDVPVLPSWREGLAAYLAEIRESIPR
jgi:dTDP-4-dehydrorhamnose reductase